MKSSKKRERRCDQCFAYTRADSRKCKFCGFKFKSSGEYLFDKIKQILNIDKVYSVDKVETQSVHRNFFTTEEIENLLEMKNLKIEMFLVLDDLAFLDETSLIQLGKTLSMMSEN